MSGKGHSSRGLYCGRFVSISRLWVLYLKPLNTINCGIGGDRTQHVLWRVDHLSLPDSVHVAVLLCGTNNIEHDLPQDIAKGVIACGTRLREKNPDLHVVVTGILPRGLSPSETRKRIQQTNSHLRLLCWTKGFLFIEPSCYWMDGTDQLNVGLYHTDHLHLVRPGNNILARQMASAISVSLSNRSPGTVTRHLESYSPNLHFTPTPP